MKENNEYEVMAPGLNHEHIKGKKNSTHATVVPRLRSRGTKETRGESLAGWLTLLFLIGKPLPIK